MINSTFHQIPVGPKWQAFFERRREILKGVPYPGLRHPSRPPKPWFMRGKVDE